jgi:hypothetical protein
MRTEAQIETEIETLQKLLSESPSEFEDKKELIGAAYQALLWALGGDDVNRYQTQPPSEIIQGRISF